jgi:hypothetical protein
MAAPQVVPIHVTILPWQKAMLDDLATEYGLLGLSETVRRVLTEYRSWKANEPATDRESAAVAAAGMDCDNGSDED